MLGGKDMKKRSLSDDEKELWKEFSRSTKPLRYENKRNHETNPKKNNQINSVNLRDHEKKYFIRSKETQSPAGQALTSSFLSMDSKLHNKLKQGKLRPEAKLDLHGLNLSQAHPVLTKFVLNAYGRGLRLILVITGKGRNSEDHDVIPRRKGILKATVPSWLAMEPLSSKVLQVTNAHVRHGGDGAFYVYLRKKR